MKYPLDLREQDEAAYKRGWNDAVVEIARLIERELGDPAERRARAKAIRDLGTT